MLSQVVYTGVLGTQAYGITFPFLQQAHVFATVNGAAKVLTTDFTINGAGTVLTFGAGTTIANGDRIVLYRVTPNLDSQRLVDFMNGSVITEFDLDTSAVQLLHIVQEGFDKSSQSLQLAADGSNVWDGLAHRVTNIVAAVGGNDAVTLTQLQNALIANGNLPVVTAGQNDYMLVVVAGAWAVRTPAQVRASLGLGTAAQVNVGTGVSNVVQLDAITARLPAVDGRNLTNLDFNTVIQGLVADSAKTPTLVLSYADTALPNNVSATWKTDTAGTIGRMDIPLSGISTAFVAAQGSGDAATDLFTLQPGTWELAVDMTIANTGVAATSTIDIAVTGATGTALWNSAGYTLEAKPAGATHSAPITIHVTFTINVAVQTDFALKARHNNAAGTVKCYGEGTRIVCRRYGAPGGA